MRLLHDICHKYYNTFVKFPFPGKGKIVKIS